ncbi:MAG: hypothetical protein ACOC0E_13845 [Spirochaetota bacterium]
MIWIIIVAAIVIVAGAFWTSQRLKVLKQKSELEREIQGVLDSFGSLREKIAASEIRKNEKDVLLDNVRRSIDQLERWKNTAIPNVTFFKNDPEPIWKEFADLKESVARDLSQYKDLPNSLD